MLARCKGKVFFTLLLTQKPERPLFLEHRGTSDGLPRASVKLRSRTIRDSERIWNCGHWCLLGSCSRSVWAEKSRPHCGPHWPLLIPREGSACVHTHSLPGSWAEGSGGQCGDALHVFTHTSEAECLPTVALMLPGALGAAESPRATRCFPLETKPVFQLWELPKQHPDR